jgi:hypothetical protein
MESRIEAVTVYRQGARVARACELDLDGPREVRIGGLPLCLDDASLTARVEALDEGAPAVATEVRVALDLGDAVARADDDSLEAAADEVERLRLACAQLEDDLRSLSLLSLAERPKRGRGEAPQASPTRARLALVELRAARAQALGAELTARRVELRRAERRHAELADRDRRSSSARQARSHELRKVAVVTLEVPEGAARRARVWLEYLVPGARWAPAYTLRFDEGLGKVALAMRALVAQKSGEDWSAVRVTLSTAAPQVFTDLPELTSKRIGRAQPPPPKRGFRAPPRGAEELYEDYARGLRREPPPPQPRSEAELMPALADGVYDDHDAPADVGGLEQRLQKERPAAHAPPPPGAAMPLPAQAMPTFAMPMTKSRGGGMLSGLFSGGGGYAPASVEPEMARNLVQAGLDEGGGAPLAPETIDLADYGRLRMPPPHAATRGKLTALSRQEIYLELFVGVRAVTTVEIGAELDTARQRAEAIDEGRLPARHRIAWSDAYDYAYAAETPLDVPSDGEFHNVPVVAAEASSRVLHVVAPREALEVFRVARIDNPLDAPLLAGPADIYVGASYLATSDVRFTAKRGRMRVGLGVDQGVKVARNARFREESAGLMGGTLILRHDIEVDLANHSGAEIELEVRERLPTLREGEDEIKVELGEVAPPWEPFEPEARQDGEAPLRGGHRWKVALADGASRKLSAAYAVRIASKHELVGGNRRES